MGSLIGWKNAATYRMEKDDLMPAVDRYEKKRIKMVDSQIRGRGITDQRVLTTMQKIPRHLFVDEGLIEQAYNDGPLPIDERQTISQPYMVALMTEALALKGKEKVLEIGTGSGYQTAILAELAASIFSIERIALLASKARKRLDILHYYNVAIRVGDGTYGWREESPFDAIIVAAGAPDVPRLMIEQLGIGGRLVLPVGDRSTQELIRITRLSEDLNDVKKEQLGGCRFVNLIGEYGWEG